MRNSGRSHYWAMLLIANCMAIGACMFVGCSRSGMDRQAVHGEVTYQSKPIEDGEIIFAPRSPGLPMASGKIVAGKYEIGRAVGVGRGEYDVKITAFRKTGRTVEPSPYSQQREPVDEVEQFLPAEFNEATRLSVTVDAADAPLDFRL